MVEDNPGSLRLVMESQTCRLWNHNVYTWLDFRKPQEKQADEIRRAELGKRLAQLQTDVNAASLVSTENKKLWNDELDENLRKIGHAPLEDDPCI